MAPGAPWRFSWRNARGRVGIKYAGQVPLSNGQKTGTVPVFCFEVCFSIRVFELV
jgi:hypothetical protein